MGKFEEDITGKQFGRWTAIKRVEDYVAPKGNVLKQWLCKCSCGIEKPVNFYNLVRGKSISCGCYNREIQRSNYKDISGKRFGKLIVIKRDGKTPKGQALWLCKCDCGGETITTTGHLNDGHTTSCGCYRDEVLLKAVTKEEGEADRNIAYRSYVYGAKARNLEFDLSFDEFIDITSKNCFYCGRSPQIKNRNRFVNGSYPHNGIDRLDSKKGYSKENCATCCWRCNKIKKALPYNEFIIFVKEVYENLFLKREEDVFILRKQIQNS